MTQEALKEASDFFDHWPWCTVKVVESWLIKRGLTKAQINRALQTLLAHNDIFQWPDANCLARFNPSTGIRLDEYKEFVEEYGGFAVKFRPFQRVRFSRPFDTFLNGEPAISPLEKVHHHSWKLIKDPDGSFRRICKCGKSVRAWKSMRKNLSNVLDAVSRLKQEGLLSADDVREAVDSLGLNKRECWDLFATITTILRFRTRLPDEQFVHDEIVHSKILRDLIDVCEDPRKLNSWSHTSQTRYKFVIAALHCLPDLAA
jgi:hypothetical protein